MPILEDLISVLEVVNAPEAGSRESPSDCMKIVQDVFKEMEITIPESEIDHAYRVGPTKQVNNRREQATTGIAELLHIRVEKSFQKVSHFLSLVSI